MSLVQTFTELPPRPSEEIFMVLNFAPVLQRDHTHHQLFGTIACTIANAQDPTLEMAANLSMKMQNFAPCEISHSTVR